MLHFDINFIEYVLDGQTDMSAFILLTYWGRDKMDAISQTPFSKAFSWMKTFEFRLNCHWSLFLRVQLTIFQHWFRQWLGADQETSHYLNRWWIVYWRIYASLGLNELRTRSHYLNQWRSSPMTHIWVIGFQRIKFHTCIKFKYRNLDQMKREVDNNRSKK